MQNPDKEQEELQEKSKKIDSIFKDAINKVNETGKQAVSYLRELKKKKEEKKVEEILKNLKK